MIKSIGPRIKSIIVGLVVVLLIACSQNTTIVSEIENSYWNAISQRNKLIDSEESADQSILASPVRSGVLLTQQPLFSKDADQS